MTTAKTIALTRRTFVDKVMSLLFNKLSRLVITFLPRSKHLLISWLQSPSAVISEHKKIKSVTVSTVSPSICHKVIGPDAMILVFWMLSFQPVFSLSSFTFIKVTLRQFTGITRCFITWNILFNSLKNGRVAWWRLLWWHLVGDGIRVSGTVLCKQFSCQCRRHRKRSFNCWVGKIPWRRKWQPAPVFLPGESHGQRILVGYSPGVVESLDMTEHTVWNTV